MIANFEYAKKIHIYICIGEQINNRKGFFLSKKKVFIGKETKKTQARQGLFKIKIKIKKTSGLY